MYKIYSLTYDLHKPGQNYEALKKELKASTNWWHYLQSTWLIYTSETANQLWNRIAPIIDKNDSVLIIEVRNNKQGWLPEEAWKWINSHIV